MAALLLPAIALFANITANEPRPANEGEKPGSSYGKQYYRFYIGTGNSKLSHPIFLCELDPEEQKMTLLDSFPAMGGAGYLSLSPDGLYLYATSGESIPGEEGSASVASFRVLEDHRLEAINRQSSKGRGNCHVSTSPDGRYVFAANYGSGHAAVLPVEEGLLKEASSVVKGKGSGPNRQRQEGPHAHQVVQDPSGRFLLVPDLGTDKIMNYSFDPEGGTLKPNPEQPYLAMPPGTGPRHLAFHPSGRYVYILGELDATLTACSYNAGNGKLKILNAASIVEEGFDGNRQSAAVRVHPSGKFVYASNRDDSSNLAAFGIAGDGLIRRIQIVKDIPYWPRDFNITPDGRYIISAGGRADELALYSIDPGTGKLSSTGSGLSLPGPICILFIPGPESKGYEGK